VVSESGRRLSIDDKNRCVTAGLLASNVTGVEKYAKVLLAGRPAASSGPARWLLPALNSLADDITAAITCEVGEYAESGDDAAARAVRRLARDAVAGFAARVTQLPAADDAEPRETTSAASMFHDLGRLLAMEGRSINALHAALRIGARVTWQRLQEQARQGNGNPEVFARIGETVYWYMDELAASCSAGYAEATAELAGETSQLRRRLLDMLTCTPARLRWRSRAWPTRPAGPSPAGSRRWRSRPRPGATQARCRLARTLLAWMESADDANAAGRRLHVHPQTIRYRLRQVSEIFGDALDDPDARFRLLLALRVRQLLGGAAEPGV
jgi:hypothetical protein